MCLPENPDTAATPQPVTADRWGQRSLRGQPIPAVVLSLAADARVDPELAWHNELGGMTFRLGSERHVKWNPRATGVDLARERDRLGWLDGRHPAPRVLAWGEDEDAQWLVTASLPGDVAVGEPWRHRPDVAIAAIARGLRALHAIPTASFPPDWTAETWVGRAPANLGPRPALVEPPVLVHGDACAPNTLVLPNGTWTGNVDFGDLAVGDRWADLAVASLSLDWNFGEGHQDELFAAYGIERDEERIRWYRALWEQES